MDFWILILYFHMHVVIIWLVVLRGFEPNPDIVILDVLSLASAALTVLSGAGNASFMDALLLFSSRFTQR